MSNNVYDKTVQKLIAMLKADATVTAFCGSGSAARVYGSHLSTIQDWVLPAVSIHLLESPGRGVSGGALDVLEFQIEPWMNAVGNNANVWDDVMQLHGAMMDVLHRTKGWDDSIGIKIIEITNVGEGGQIQDPDGIMHFPSRWKVRATV